MISDISRRVVFVVYPQFDLLDLSGPLEVFTDASHYGGGGYRSEVVSAEGGLVASYTGVPVLSGRAAPGDCDTVVVVGTTQEGLQQSNEPTLELIRDLAGRTRRIASVCTGAFMLARAGLLDGRSASTHWRYAQALQAEHPEVRVDADKIFIREGAVWTSAGATAGIDLALAMIEEDVGQEVSKAIARGLVVYHRRLGGQSQFSALLDLEPDSDRIARALRFARDHLHEPLPVARLAEAASLSERQFTRAFHDETGMTPAKAIERLRAEAARPLIEETRHSLDVICRMVGFTDPERMRLAFMKIYGHPPRVLRRATPDGPQG